MLRFAQLEGARRGGHTWWALVAGKGPPRKTWRIAPPLAQSSPPGKGDREGSGDGEMNRENNRGGAQGSPAAATAAGGGGIGVARRHPSLGREDEAAGSRGSWG